MSLLWAHMPFCRFCHEAAHSISIVFMTSSKNSFHSSSGSFGSFVVVGGSGVVIDSGVVVVGLGGVCSERDASAMQYESLSYDVAVIQWLTLCHTNRMTTHYITLSYWRVTS